MSTTAILAALFLVAVALLYFGQVKNPPVCKEWTQRGSAVRGKLIVCKEWEWPNAYHPH